MKTEREATLHACMVAACYAAVSGAWILFSDRIEIGSDLPQYQTLKGLAFVLVTSWMLFKLIGRLLRRESLALSHSRRSSALLQAIADGSTDAIYAKDLEGRYILSNAATHRFMGAERMSAPGADDHSLFRPEEAQRLRANDQRVMSEDRVISFEESFTAPGGPMTLSSIKGPLHDADGNLVGVFGISRDMSEFRQAIEVARRWQRVFELANFGLAYHRSDTGTYVDVNEQFAAQRGYTREELRDQPLSCIYPPEDHARITGLLKESDIRGHVTFEGVHVRKDGSRFPVLVELATLAADGDRVLSRVSYAVDISERKVAEDKLRKLSLAVEQSPESVVVTNLKAEIEYVNEAFLKVTGYAREEVLGRNPRLLRSGRTPRTTYEAMWSTLRQGESWRGEFMNRRKDGTDYVEFAVVSPIRDDSGAITHYVAVKEDITEKKRIGR